MLNGDDRQLTIALARDPSAEGKNVTTTWSVFAARLAKHAQRGLPTDFEDDPEPCPPEKRAKFKLDAAKFAPCFMLGALKDGETEKTIKNMRSLELLTIDLDDVGAEALGHVYEQLKPFAFAAYTTHKHDSRKGLWRMRFVLPLAQPELPERYKELWSRLQVVCSGRNDPATKNVNRLNYFPSSPDPTVHAKSLLNVGRFITPDDLPKINEEEYKRGAKAPSKAPNEVYELVQKRMTHKPGDVGKWFRLVFKGEELAETGARHETFKTLTWELAKVFPKLTREIVDRIFSPCIQVMSANDPSCDNADAVWAAYAGAVTKIEDARADKLTKKKQELLKTTAPPKSASAPEQTSDSVPEDSTASGTESEVTDDRNPYTAAELRTIAEEQHCEPGDLERRWIVYRDGTFWFLGEGGYGSPHTQTDAGLNIYNALAKAPIDIIRITEAGNATKKKLNEIATEYGCRADHVITHLGERTAWFEPAGIDAKLGKVAIFHEVTAAPRLWKFQPQFYENIDKWLRLLAGPSYEKVLDWLAICPDLTKTIAGLYLCGIKGAGKSLLPAGISQIWHDGPPTPAELALGNFNESVAQCPLIFADETLPKLYGGQDTAAILREEMFKTERLLKRKYKTETTLKGNARWVFAANDDNMIRSEGAFSRETIAAIAERFVFVDVKEEAREYIISVGQDERDEWKNHKIAEHVLYLSQTRQVKHGQRVWVDGDVSRMTQELIHGNEYSSLICEFSVCYYKDPSKIEQQPGGRTLIRRQGGKLLVNSRAFVEFWNVYLSHERTKPSQRKIGEALVSLSKKERVLQRVGGVMIAYREVDLAAVIDWNKKHDVMTEEELRAAIEKDTVDKGPQMSVV